MEEAQQKIQLNDLERSHTGGGEFLGTVESDTGGKSSPFFHSFIHSHIWSTYNALDAELGAETLSEKTGTDLAFSGCTVQWKRQALKIIQQYLR